MKYSWLTFLLLEREFCEEVAGFNYEEIINAGRHGYAVGMPCPSNAVCVGNTCRKCLYGTGRTIEEWKVLLVEEYK